MVFNTYFIDLFLFLSVVFYILSTFSRQHIQTVYFAYIVILETIKTSVGMSDDANLAAANAKYFEYNISQEYRVIETISNKRFLAKQVRINGRNGSLISTRR